MSQDDDWLYEKQTAVIRVVATPRRRDHPVKGSFAESNAADAAASRLLKAEDLILQLVDTNKTNGVIQWYETRCLNTMELVQDDDSQHSIVDGTIGVDFSLTLLSRPGEEDRILQGMRDTLAQEDSRRRCKKEEEDDDDVVYYDFDLEVLLTAPGYVPMVSAQFSRQTDLVLSCSHGVTPTESSDIVISDCGTLAVNDSDSNNFESYGVTVCPIAVKDTSTLLTTAFEFIRELEFSVTSRHSDIDYGKDDFVFREVASRGGERFDALLDLDNDGSRWQQVREIARETAPWLPFVCAILKDEWKVTVSLIYSRPGADNQQWHCDGGHLGGQEAGFDGQGQASPYAVCVFMPLIDLNAQVGFTQFFLKSHKTSKLIGFGEAAHLLAATFDGIVHAGESVIYDYRLMHRGMANQSTETVRPVLQFLYAKPHYVETKNYSGASMYA